MKIATGFNRFYAVAPYVVAAIALIVAGSLYVKLRQVRTRLSIEANKRAAEEDKRLVEFRTQAREDQIFSALSATKYPIVVIGDSLTERSGFPADICGHPVINAGVSGIGVSRTLPVAERLAHFPTAAVVFAVGVNDASKYDWMSGRHQPAFKLAYQAAIAAALVSTPNVMVANITPVDFDGSVGSLMDPGGHQAIEGVIRELVEELPIKAIDLSNLRVETGNLHIDGVHLSLAGKDAWMNKIVTGIANSLGCKALLTTDAVH